MNELGRLRLLTEEQTVVLGRRLAAVLTAGDVVALIGPLGAGKTRLTQGVARGLGVPEQVPVTSPTFTLLGIYPQGRLPLFHFDWYRLETADELARIGADEYLWGEGVCVVEWAERIGGAIPDEALWITLDIEADETRTARLTGPAAQWQNRLADLLSMET